MTFTFPTFSISNLIEKLQTLVAPASEQIFKVDEDRSNRTCLHELVCCNPDAIHVEFGLVALMSRYPEGSKV